MSWGAVPLSSVSKTFADGDWVESKDQSPEGIRLVQTGNVGEGRFKDRRDKARFISTETFARLNCTEVLPGDVLVSRLPDPVGRACIVPPTGDKMITAVDCTIVRPEAEKLDQDYLVYYTQSKVYQRDIEDRCTGTTRKRISRKNLGLIPIPLPPLEEQKRIVAVLDQAFAALDRARALAEANLADAEELFEAFVREALSSMESKHGLSLLDSHVDFRNGFAFKSAKFSDHGQPVVRISNIQGGRVDLEKVVFSRQDDYEEDLSRYHVEPDELLIAMSGATTGKIGFNDTGGTLLQNQRVGRFSKSSKINLQYLAYILETKVAEHLAISAGAAQPNLSTKQIREISLPIPDADEQRAFVEALDRQKERLETVRSVYATSLSDLDDLRQSILQKAFAGDLT